jgi:hypothetical protein
MLSSFIRQFKQLNLPLQNIAMMLEGLGWDTLFKRAFDFAQLEQSYKNRQLDEIYGGMKILMQKRLSDDNVRQMLVYLQKEAQVLDGRPSPLDSIRVMLNGQSTLASGDTTDAPISAIASTASGPVHTDDPRPPIVDVDAPPPESTNQNSGSVKNEDTKVNYRPLDE